MRSRGCISSQKQVPVWERRRALGECEEVYPSNKLKIVYSAWCPQETEDCVLSLMLWTVGGMWRSVPLQQTEDCVLSDPMNWQWNVKKYTPPPKWRLFSVWCHQQTADCVLSLMLWTVGGMWRSVPLQHTEDCVLSMVPNSIWCYQQIEDCVLSLMPWTNWRLCTQSDAMNCWRNVKKCTPPTNWRLCTQSDAMNKLKTVYSVWCHQQSEDCVLSLMPWTVGGMQKGVPL